MSDRIYYNYGRLLEYAHEMEILADNIDEYTLERLDDITQKLITEIEGPIFDAYYAMYLTFREDMEKLPEILRNYAQLIRDSVNSQYEIDRQAAELISDALF